MAVVAGTKSSAVLLLVSGVTEIVLLFYRSSLSTAGLGARLFTLGC